MDAKQVRSAIIDAYNRTVGKSVDAKTMQYLTTSVTKGENTLASIINTLMNTDEYKERAKSMFTITFFDAIGNNPTIDEFDQFWNSIDKTRIVESFDIEVFVRKSDSFRTKYAEVITNIYKKAHNITPDSDTIERFLGKLASNVQYDDHSIAYDIENISLSPINNDVITPSTTPSPVSQPATLPAATPQSTTPKLQLDTERLAAFEAAFGRNMYVKEYFKYIVNPTPQECQRYFSNLDMIYTEHKTDYNKVANIYSSYCNMDLTEPEYIDIHLMDVDQPRYFDMIVDNIVNTPEHKEFMCATLQAYYKKLYDLTMDESDLIFLFNKVREEKLHPKDERLVEILKEFKAETDDFIEHIFTVYKRVLERQPDMYEIEGQLMHYRVQSLTQDIAAIDSAVAMQLTKTLEFHDIIKKHIKSLYHATHAKDITPSRLFQILQEMVDKVKYSDVSIDTLDKFIQSSESFTSTN